MSSKKTRTKSTFARVKDKLKITLHKKYKKKDKEKNESSSTPDHQDETEIVNVDSAGEIQSTTSQPYSNMTSSPSTSVPIPPYSDSSVMSSQVSSVSSTPSNSLGTKEKDATTTAGTTIETPSLPTIETPSLPTIETVPLPTTIETLPLPTTIETLPLPTTIETPPPLPPTIEALPLPPTIEALPLPPIIEALPLPPTVEALSLPPTIETIEEVSERDDNLLPMSSLLQDSLTTSKPTRPKSASLPNNSTLTNSMNSFPSRPPLIKVKENVSDRKLQLIMEVVISPLKKEILSIYEGDIPEDLAIQFSQEHNLGSSAVQKLSQHIRNQLQMLSQSHEPDETSNSYDELEASNSEPRINNGDYSSEMSHEGQFNDPTFKMESRYMEDEFQNKSIMYEMSRNKRNFQTSKSMNSEMTDQEEFYDGNEIRPSSSLLSGQNQIRSEYSNKNNEEMYNQFMNEIGSNHAMELKKKKGQFKKKMDSPISDKGKRQSGAFKRSNSAPKFRSRASANDAVFQRLYANAGDKTLHQERLKREYENQERQQLEKSKFVLPEKSRRLMSHYQQNMKPYKNAGERLFAEGTADLRWRLGEAEKTKTFKADKEDWNCPLCGFQNSDKITSCENVVGVRISQLDISSNERKIPEELRNILCGQPKPQLFQPTFIARSKYVVSSAAKPNVYDNLYQDANTLIRREKLQDKLQAELAQSCTFKPSINEKSAKIALERRSRILEEENQRNNNGDTSTLSSTAFDLLYMDAELRRVRQEEVITLEEQPSFSPDIGVNKLRPKTDRTEFEFINRLVYGHLEEKEKTLAKLKEKYAEDINPETGQKYFKPQVGRAPIFNRNDCNLPIGEFLFASRHEFNDIRDRLSRQYEEEFERENHKRFLSETSYQLVLSRKQKTCEQIIKTISSGSLVQEEDIIWTSNLKLDDVKPPLDKVVHMAIDILNHGDWTKDCVISRRDLIHSLMIAFDRNPVGIYSNIATPRNVQESSKDNDEELTFHPKVDKNSAEIAKKKRNSNLPIYEYLTQQSNVYDMKKKKLEEEYRREELKECSFKPKLNSRKGIKDIYERLAMSSAGNNPSKKDFPLLVDQDIKTFESPPLTTVKLQRPIVSRILQPTIPSDPISKKIQDISGIKNPVDPEENESILDYKSSLN